MENENQQEPENPERKSGSSHGLIFLLVLLFLLNAAGGVYYYFDSQQKAALRLAQKNEIDQLSAQKEKLAADIDKLTGQLKAQAGQNEKTNVEIKELREEIAKKNKTISSLGGKDVQVLRQQIADLLRVRNALQARLDSATVTVTRIRVLVDSLKTENEILLALNKNLRRAIPDKTDSMKTAQDALAGKKDSASARDPKKPRVVIGKSKTNGFKVEVLRKKDRMTVKARRTRELMISFEVISELEGQRPIYMVVADAKGQAVKDESAKKVKIYVEGEPKEITYHGTTQIDFGKGHASANFKYSVNDKLLKGSYKFLVYSEDALLGFAEFRLE